MKDLSRYVPGAVYRILSLGEESRTSIRLTQMGVLPGAEVTVVRVAPFGGPVELAQEDGQDLALRPQEASAVRYQLVAFPLTHPGVQPGDRVCVRRLNAGAAYRARMRSRGIQIGTCLEVVSTKPYRLRTGNDGQELTLGRGEAGKLLMESVPVSDGHRKRRPRSSDHGGV